MKTYELKETELRLGNWIEGKASNREFAPFQVYKETFFDIEDTHRSFRAIELTDKWFLKSGMQQHHEDFGNGFIMFKKWYNATDEGVIQDGWVFKLYPKILGSAVQGRTVKLYFVHQYQNLMFALFNEEVTFTQQ